MDESACLKRPRCSKLYLVITNISKRNNVRCLLRTAAAFQCAGVFVVGQKSFDFTAGSPDFPTSISETLPIQRFARWAECVDHLKENSIRLVGVEIHQDAQSVDAYFDGIDTAFLMGNEGDGLNDKQMKSCDAFVRIPQYGGGTASLNVYVACSIIFHRFHHWQRQLGSNNP